MEVPPVIKPAHRINRRGARKCRGLTPNRLPLEREGGRCHQRSQNRCIRAREWPAVEPLGQADDAEHLPATSNFL